MFLKHLFLSLLFFSLDLEKQQMENKQQCLAELIPEKEFSRGPILLSVSTRFKAAEQT